MAKSKKPVPSATDASPGSPANHGPFAGLAALRDKLPAGNPMAPPAPQDVAASPPRGPARAVVRYERAGRRGKEATVIEKLALPASELEAWCKALKKAMGCGGSLEGDTIVLQGDQRTRVATLLESRGVRKITIA